MVGNQKIPSPSGITFESVAAGTYAGSFVSSWTHTVGASANCLLVLAYSNSIFAPAVGIDTGQKLTYINGLSYAAFANIYYHLYGLLNPTVGTRTISIDANSFGGYSSGGASIAYSGVTGFAANAATFAGSTTSLSLSLPAFPGGVAVMGTNVGWSSATQTSRQNSGSFGWQESTTNTGNTRSFSTTWAASGTYHAVGVVLK
jgi:hypothetical protein